MTDRRLGHVLRHIRKMAGSPDAPERTDRQLLERFASQRDEAAFAALVGRHGPLVLGICWRVLQHTQDAEDVFQATFLVLARKAAALPWQDSVAPWLYKVAYRLAVKAKARAARRREQERQAGQMPRPGPAPDPAWRELGAVLDEELHRLPEKYCQPLVLCYLQRQTGDQAARLLGWSLRTLQRRLEQGRELLRHRLTRRGLALSGSALTAIVSGHASPAAVPLPLVDSTIKAALLIAAGKLATEAVSSQVAVLLKGALRTMFWTKVKTIVGLVAVMGAVGSGAVLLGGGALGEGPKPLQAGGPQGAGQADPPPAGRHARQGAAPAPGQPVDAVPLAQAREHSRANLKQLGQAMLLYYNLREQFPAPALYSGQGAAQAAGMMQMMMGQMRGQMMGKMMEKGGPAGGMGPAGMMGRMGRGGGRPGGAMGMGGAGMAPAGGMGMGMAGGGGMPPGRADRVIPGKPLLSWRVALLPFLGEEGLYHEFKLDESWDSPSNKKLLAKIPQVYAPVRHMAEVPAGSTYYQVFVGPGAGFEKHRALNIYDIPDGTSNTIMIVEAGSPVPWTKPEDLTFDPDEPLPELGGLFPDGFDAVFFDGSVHTIKRNADEQLLRALVTRNGGEVVDTSQLFEPEGPAAEPSSGRLDGAGLRAENKKLKQELRQAQENLQRLKAEAAEAAARKEAEETAQLREENARLKQQIEQVRDQTRREQEFLEQLRRPRPAPDEPPRKP